MDISKYFEKSHTYILAILRVFVGIVFVFHGYEKLMAPEMIVGMVTKLGFPIPLFFAWALILSEFLGGIGLILGFFTRVFSAFLIFSMAVALFMVHFKNGFSLENGGFEYVLVLIGSLLVFLSHGGGKVSFDQLLFKGKI